MRPGLPQRIERQRWWLIREKRTGYYLDAIGSSEGVNSQTIRFSTKRGAVNFIASYDGMVGATEPKLVTVVRVVRR